VEAVDEQVILVFSSVAKNEIGRDKLVTIESAGVSALEVIAQVISRCHHAPITLRRACNVVSELTTAPVRIAASAFISSTIVKAVLGALAMAEAVTLRDQALGLASDALDALRKMANLGGDQCGVMQIDGCRDATIRAICYHSTSGDVAIRGSKLIEALSSAPRGAALINTPTRDFFAELLTFWHDDLNVMHYVQRTVRVLEMNSSPAIEPSATLNGATYSEANTTFVTSGNSNASRLVAKSRFGSGPGKQTCQKSPSDAPLKRSMWGRRASKR
jgi:hypothetical protein